MTEREVLKLALEPTKEMIDAAERIDWSGSDVRGNIVNMWQAMCAAQPGRTWVGLTKYEHDEILITSFNKVHHAIKLTQDKLKEKNT